MIKWLTSWWRASTKQRGHLVLESRSGLVLRGWAATVDGSADAPVSLAVDGITLESAIHRVPRADVALTLGGNPQDCFGFEVLLPPSIWHSDGTVKNLSIACAGQSLVINDVPAFEEAALAVLALPASWDKERQVQQLIVHLQTLGSCAGLSLGLRSRIAKACDDRYGVTDALSVPAPAGEPVAVKGHVDGMRGLTIFGWAMGALPGKESLWLRCHDQTLHVRARRLARSDVSSHWSAPDAALGFEIDIPACIWSEFAPATSSLTLEVLADLQPITSAAPLHLSVDQLVSALTPLPTLSDEEFRSQPIELRLRHLLLVSHCTELQAQQRLSQPSAIVLAHQALSLRLPLGQHVPPEFTAPQKAEEATPAVWVWLRHLNDQLSKPVNAGPALDAVWSQIDASPARQEWLMAVAPWACAQGRFDWVAERAHAPTWKTLMHQPSSWALSLALVWLTHQNKPKLALAVSGRLVELPDSSGWLNTECIEQTTRLLAELDATQIAERPAWLETLLNLGRLVCRASSSVWGRGHDQHLTRTAVLLLHIATELPTSSESQKVWTDLLDAQSFNPSFWDAFQASPRPMPETVRARHQLISAWQTAFTSKTSPSVQEIADLAQLIASGNTEALRWHTEWLNSQEDACATEAVLAAIPPAEHLRDCYQRHRSREPSASYAHAIAGALSALPAIEAPPQKRPQVLIVFAKADREAGMPTEAMTRRLNEAGIRWLCAMSGSRTTLLDTHRLSLSLGGQPPSTTELWLAIIEWFTTESHAEALCILPHTSSVNVCALLDHDPIRYPYIGPTDYWIQAPLESVQPLDRLTDSAILHPATSGCILSSDVAIRLSRTLNSPPGRIIRSTARSPDRVILDLLALQNIKPAAHSPRLIHPALMNAWRKDNADGAQRDSCLWPTECAPSISSPKSDNALKRLSPPARLAIIKQAPVVVVLAVRNEMVLLPHCLAHYRSLGVTCFIVIDNGSTDGSVAYLSEQTDTVLYSAESEYRAAHYGVSWQKTVLAHHCIGKWVVVADADEFLVYQNYENIKLSEWLRGLKDSGQNTVMTLQLDMYPSPPLSRVDFREVAPFDSAKWLDSQPVNAWHLGSGQYSHSKTYLSALRHRIVKNAAPNSFTAQKIAIFEYMPWNQFSEGFHYASNVTLGPQFAYFAHFKYHKDFHAKVFTEVLREQHFENASEYSEYSKWLNNFEDSRLWPAHKIEFSGSSSLQEIQVLQDVNAH